jgi:TolA-binding protein
MEPPLWKKAFDAAEKQAGPMIGKALSNPKVIDAITLTMAVERRAREDLAEFVRRQLHMANLPAGTDVQKVSNQIANLERQIRQLNRRLDQLQTEVED